MNKVMTKEELAQILDQALQDVTERTAGVRLHQGEQPPGEDLCTVHITFDKGFGTSLTLCADTSLLARLARGVQQGIPECTLRQGDRGAVPGDPDPGPLWPARILPRAL